MSAERESEGYPSGDFSDYVLSEYRELLEHSADSAPSRPRSAPSQTRSVPRDARPQRGKTPPQSSAHRAGQRPAAERPSAAHRPDDRRRRAARQKRRRRQLVLFLALALVVGAVFIAANITVARVKDFQVTSASTTQQVLSWTGSDHADGYRIYDGSGTLLTELAAGAGTQYAVEGLQSGTQYTYSIRAVKSFLGKHAGRAVNCSAYTLLEPVHDLTAINSGTGALLSWEDNGASGYEVQYTDGYGTSNTVEAPSGTAGQFSIPDLQEGTQYTFQLRSFILDGMSRIYSEWTSSAPITAVHTADMAGIDVTKPMVALTFDDGPDYEDVTTRILDTLKQYGGHATFFQLGDRASSLPGVMTRMAQEGHEIACHTYDHTHYGDSVSANDIIRGNDAIEQASGKRPSAFRSPGGATTDLIRETCRSEGIPIVYWSLDTEDWSSRDADAVCNAVMDRVKDGDIVLMHNIYSSTADAVERIVPYLAEKGYQMVTVSQLVLAKTGAPPVPGTQYVTATTTN